MIIAEAQATYNRSTKHWQTINGKVVASYPAGPDGKRQAQQQALAINRPDLSALVHAVATKHSYDVKAINMAIKAAHIIEAELLYSNGTCHSQSRAGVFHVVTYDDLPKQYHCTCEAFSYCPIHIEGIGFLCKHCLADHWVYLLGIELPRQPIPFNNED